MSTEFIIYIPDFEGNREKSENEQVTVEIKPMTVRESRKLAGQVTAKRAKGGSFKTNAAALTIEMLQNHVGVISNLSWNGRPITSMNELMDTTLLELADEIELAVQNSSTLSEGEVKNLRSQSTGD